MGRRTISAVEMRAIMYQAIAAALTRAQHEAEKDRTAAREHQAIVNARCTAGHDWEREAQERIQGQRRR